MSSKIKYFGKYRGRVVNNVDPEQMGRLQLEVPEVREISPSAWAMPCVPLAGTQSGTYLVPLIGSSVWVDFEAGDPDRPVWTGCFWPSSSQMPAQGLSGNPMSPSIVIQSDLGNSIVISDLAGAEGGIILKSPTGATLIVNDSGIYIQNGKGASIVLVGPTVTVNQGALVIP